jgi:hypothetical protein
MRDPFAIGLRAGPWLRLAALASDWKPEGYPSDCAQDLANVSIVITPRF